jgi:hypothetical protein
MQKLEQESGIDPLLLGFEASAVRFSKKRWFARDETPACCQSRVETKLKVYHLDPALLHCFGLRLPWFALRKREIMMGYRL